MDPVTMVVTALAVGAAAGVQDTAKTVISDAYGKLKSAITARYDGVDLEPVTQQPDSLPDREELIAKLTGRGAEEDRQLIIDAHELIEALRSAAPRSGDSIGINLDQISAESVRIKDIHTFGSAIRIAKSEIEHEIDISNVVVHQPPAKTDPGPS